MSNVFVSPDETAPADTMGAQPLREITVGTTHFTILGTAHVSKASADAVESHLRSGSYDAVAIELDAGRYDNLRDPERWAKTDLFEVLKEGKTAMMAAQLALGAFQQRLAEQSGINPGEEMRRAIKVADELRLPIWLIDRDIGTTLKRVYRNVGFWDRLNIIAGLLASVVSQEEVSEKEIEELKEGDMLEATFAEFADKQKNLFVPLITERDHFMAAKLRQESEKTPLKRVLVVIGAGHLKGLSERLEHPPKTPPSEELEQLVTLKKGFPWGQVVSWGLVVFFVFSFIYAFMQSADTGWDLIVRWILLNGGLAALGAIIALAHPLTAVVTFLTAPIGTLSPTLGVGMFAAATELWLRKPKMADFSALRHDITTAKGWWHNKVARIFLIFFLTSLGGAIGNLSIFPKLLAQYF